MPLYEYKCCNCHTTFEWLARHGDLDENGKAIGLKCPYCFTMDKDNFVKQISLTNFELKGEGWYKDGYSSKKASD